MKEMKEGVGYPCIAMKNQVCAFDRPQVRITIEECMFKFSSHSISYRSSMLACQLEDGKVRDNRPACECGTTHLAKGPFPRSQQRHDYASSVFVE